MKNKDSITTIRRVGLDQFGTLEEVQAALTFNSMSSKFGLPANDDVLINVSEPLIERLQAAMTMLEQTPTIVAQGCPLFRHWIISDGQLAVLYPDSLEGKPIGLFERIVHAVIVKLNQEHRNALTQEEFNDLLECVKEEEDREKRDRQTLIGLVVGERRGEDNLFYPGALLTIFKCYTQYGNLDPEDYKRLCAFAEEHAEDLTMNFEASLAIVADAIRPIVENRKPETALELMAQNFFYNKFLNPQEEEANPAQ